MTIQTLDYGDYRILAFTEYGDPAGYPILAQHGLIASINDGLLFQRLVDAGRRVVCIARPGYGRSSPYAMVNIAAWGDIVSRLVVELDIERFDVLGMSSGAPYTYAIGHRMPEHTRRIWVFSGTPALYDERVLAEWPYPVNDGATTAQMQRLARELFFAEADEGDTQSDDIRDSMAHSCFGVAQDLRLRHMDWGFSLEDVQQPVIMEHSREDGEVPFIAAELTAQLLPNCELRAREGVHFSPEALDRFLATMLPLDGASD